jgi:hypothetical protein
MWMTNYTWIPYLIGFIGLSTFINLVIDMSKYSFWRRVWITMSLWFGVYFTAWYVLAQYGVRK